jgi:hypothetical protein
MVGTALAFTQMEPDHHSTALELLNMLEKYPTKGLKGADEESKKTYDSIKKLREVLKRNKEDTKFVRDDFDNNNESSRLIL